MLFTDYLDGSAPTAHPHAASMYRRIDDPLRARMRGASVHVVDQSALRMVANLSTSRPTSVLAALRFMRPRHPKVWIEFSNEELRTAMADIGSPNRPTPDGTHRILRTGFLVTLADEGIEIDYVHADRLPDGRLDTCRALQQGVLSLEFADPDIDRALEIMAEALGGMVGSGSDRVADGATGRVARNLAAINADPKEMWAQQRLSNALRFTIHREAKPLYDETAAAVGAARAEAMLAGNERDFSRFVVAYLVPLLILMNCRNAVRLETVEAPEKLNKSRRKKGRLEIPEHTVVKMHLSEDRRAGSAAVGTGGGGGKSRPEWVEGHFKVRKTGVYWWNPHVRGAGEPTEFRRTTVITR